ncbi:MAG: LytTR family DNA-binding domain-containing protein [Sphingobacteriaceae bacterium]|nr:LytTR family DNA-binding domain-containing protein [Sphingobacteriaceae bacterium]
MKVLLVDDETNARLALRGILEFHFPEIDIAGEAKDLPEAVRKIHQLQPDVVFLDIEMPGYSGLELVNFFESDQISFKIIFVTAYSEYALQAFEISAIDYLLKPIRKEQIGRALEKLTPTLKLQMEALRENLDDTAHKRIALQLSDGLLFVQLNDILYLVADGSYTHIYLRDGQKLTVTKKLLEYEKLEQWGKFMRIHRSHIVNLEMINRILKQDGGIVVMCDGKQFSISNDKKQVLMTRFDQNKL